MKGEHSMYVPAAEDAGLGLGLAQGGVVVEEGVEFVVGLGAGGRHTDDFPGGVVPLAPCDETSGLWVSGVHAISLL